MHGHDRALHVNQIVLAQLLAVLSINKHYATSAPASRPRNIGTALANLSIADRARCSVSLSWTRAQSASDRGLDLFRERLVVVADQPQRRAERDADAARPRHPPADAEHVLQPSIRTGTTVAPAATQSCRCPGGSVDDAALGPASLRKDQHRRAVARAARRCTAASAARRPRAAAAETR